MAKLSAGSPLPPFSLLDDSDQLVELKDLKGSKILIYFYPKDDTSGCTAEACEFRDSMPRFSNEMGVKIFGVSPDSTVSHRKFKTKYNLNFPLLSDPKHAFAESVGVWVEKSMYGKKYMGIERTTLLIDEHGTVLKVWEKVKPQGHAEEVLNALHELASVSAASPLK